MAGPGVALRLHEFRASQDSTQTDGANTPKSSRVGRDVRGLHPGELGRVHIVHSEDCGYNLRSRRSQFLHESLQPPKAPCENYQPSFDLRTLRGLTVPRHRPAVPGQHPPHTSDQEQFGLQSPVVPQQQNTELIH